MVSGTEVLFYAIYFFGEVEILVAFDSSSPVELLPAFFLGICSSKGCSARARLFSSSAFGYS